MRIDQMREQDIDAITKLEQQLFPQAPWTWDGFRQELDKPTSVCLCLFDHEQVVGYAILGIALDEAELYVIGVAQAYQHLGWGQELLAQLLEVAVQRNVRTVWLEVRTNNQAAITLYEHVHFRRSGMRRDYYGRGIHAYVYRKELL